MGSAQSSKNSLHHPVNFVAPATALWPELRSGNAPAISAERLSKLSSSVLGNWVIRTYYQLRQAGCVVSIAPSANPSAINVVSVHEFGRRHFRPGCFYLIPRADAHYPMLADFVLNQNGLRGSRLREASVPHWPQQGIIAREPDRPLSIKKLTYKGLLANLDESFKSDQFIEALRKIGIRFEIDALQGEDTDHNWNDYYDADGVLAVRNLTNYDALKKPASKVINAWNAGVVPLVGPEPAFLEVRETQYDMIIVRTPEDVLEVLRRLKKDSGELSKYFEASRRRGRSGQFGEASITRTWIDLLNGPISEAFEAWKKRGLVSRVLRGIGQMALEPVSKRIDLARVHYGRRILD